MLHTLFFGTWKWGQNHGWWKTNRMPAWMQLVQKRVLSQIAKRLPPPPKPAQAVPLLFVDVDPNLAIPTPPKKFDGAANTQAANPEKKIESDIPQINGSQDKILKTTEPSTSKAQPLQPTPAKPTPQTTPATTPQPAQPEPKEAKAPGDLAFVKPQDKAQEGKSPKDKVEEQAQPTHTRPRTLDEARKRMGLQGDRMQQTGGAHRIAIDSSLDVTRTSFGDYDREFIDAVQQKWNQLLADRDANVPGKVIVEFRLHFDGRITDMKMTQNEVGELLGLICQKAVLDPAPYKRWPDEMRREIGANYREIRFTFFYLNN